jgi:hypothetical protein
MPKNTISSTVKVQLSIVSRKIRIIPMTTTTWYITLCESYYVKQCESFFENDMKALWRVVGSNVCLLFIIGAVVVSMCAGALCKLGQATIRLDEQILYPSQGDIVSCQLIGQVRGFSGYWCRAIGYDGLSLNSPVCPPVVPIRICLMLLSGQDTKFKITVTSKPDHLLFVLRRYTKHYV